MSSPSRSVKTKRFPALLDTQRQNPETWTGDDLPQLAKLMTMTPRPTASPAVEKSSTSKGDPRQPPILQPFKQRAESTAEQNPDG